VNGYLADAATTVDLDGSYESFILATQNALSDAVELMEPGVTVGKIGAVIERAIRREGLRSVYMLSGHEMRRWNLHAGLTIPNVASRNHDVICAGGLYAVEPFATDGFGAVRSGSGALIFSNDLSDQSSLDGLAREVRNMLRRRFGSLPWAPRWIRPETRYDLNAVLGTLLSAGAVRAYPVLVEASGAMVSQFEHTVFVTEDGPIVTTALNHR